MTTIASSSNVSLRSGQAFAGLAGGLRRLIAWPFEVAKARADLAMLGGLSDYELHDIGLSRQDLRNATALPLDKDPTQFLAQTVRDNQATVVGKPL
jgi:uncharacterized protein YjiS (DUF1127 family)